MDNNVVAEGDREKSAGIEDDHVPNPPELLVLEHDELPINMPLWKKWNITLVTALMTAIITFCSSVFSSAAHATAVEFHVSEVVTLLGLSLFVLGFALGPLAWGPLSERFGRKRPLLAGFFAFALFQIPLALSQNLASVLISRFLEGAFGAAAMVINSAMFADFWAPTDRGIASSVYATATFAGPTLGPILGSMIVESHLGWRWTAWVTLIVAIPAGLLALLLIPETYEPVLLERKAKQLGLTVRAGKGAAEFIQKFLTKPLRMLATEIMLIVMTVYICLIYGILYLSFYAIPYSFKQERHWKPDQASLPFVSIFVGTLVSVPVVAIYSKTYYQRRLTARGKICPEDRLPMMLLGGILLPLGLFWFAWSSSPSVNWVAPVLACSFIGAGISFVFQSGIAYIIDLYLSSAASALAANTFARSFVAAGFPLFAPAMYERLGVAWATSLLGFLCTALVPAPIIFYYYGARVRAMSKYTAKL